MHSGYPGPWYAFLRANRTVAWDKKHEVNACGIHPRLSVISKGRLRCRETSMNQQFEKCFGKTRIRETSSSRWLTGHWRKATADGTQLKVIRG